MFLSRRLILAAVLAIGTTLIGATTPGFAFELVTVNGQQADPVPPQALIPAPVTVTAPISAPPPPADAVETLAADADYASLDAAVAAQRASFAISDDVICLAGAIYFESKSEPLSGQLAVAQVILNRTKSGRFPKSICSVVTQRGQFSFVRNGQVPSIAANAQYRTAVAIARVALAQKWDSLAPDAMYFHARRVSPGWRMIKVASIGNHVFYR